MISKRYVEAVAAHVATRLHSTGTGVRCRCGACRHQIVAAARRSGIAPKRLIAALPAEPPRKRDQPKTSRRGLTGSVASAMTVTRDGRQERGVAAALALLRDG